MKENNDRLLSNRDHRRLSQIHQAATPNPQRPIMRMMAQSVIAVRGSSASPGGNLVNQHNADPDDETQCANRGKAVKGEIAHGSGSGKANWKEIGLTPGLPEGG